jgi:serine/threonine protein kinase
MKDTFASFEARFADLDLDEKTLQIEHTKTIVPTKRAYRTTREVMNALPRMTLGSESGLGGDLKLKGKLGEGGMGIIHVAEQAPLDRLVAVKTPRSATDDAAINSILQEAYITGMVEHPNVVPIYTLGQSGDGDPMIVMKRIEGVSWQAILKDPSCAPAGQVDLNAHLRILIEVCDAIRFAHHRGIIHRDIKPENVMIGRYGEVYLLDWGIAVSLVRTENPMLRHISDALGVSGTPSYMAPEMTDDDAQNIDERTDVYLLGAVLHEIMTGTGRHEGESLMRVFFSALQSEPVDYSAEVPRELGAIANKATAQKKEDRFQSVDAFRQALLDYLEHRASVELSESADQVWLRLQVLLGTSERNEAQELELHDLFGECRFGYRQALLLWSGNLVASDGFQTCLVEVTKYYISIRNDVGAAASVAQLPVPDLELKRQVAQLSEQRALEKREVTRLKKFSAANDLSTGSKTRSIVAVILGVFWGWSNISAQMAINAGIIENPILDHLMAAPRTVGTATFLMVIFRKSLFSNAANRRLMFVLIAALIAVTCGRITAYLLNADLVATQAGEIFLWAFSASMIGIISDLRITFASSLLYISGFLGALYPAYQLYPQAVASLSFFLILAFLWRKPAPIPLFEAE